MSGFTEEERRLWDLSLQREVDRLGGPEGFRKQYFAPAASEFQEAPWEEPSQHLPSPTCSEYGDTPIGGLFGESSLPSPYLRPQRERLQSEAQACRRQNPLPTPDAPADPAYYTRRTHFDEGELEGRYDYVYDDITLTPMWRYMKNSKPRLRLRPDSVIGSIATKRSFEDDLPVSRPSKKQKTTADQDSIDSSLVAQSLDVESLDTPRPASSSRTAAEIGREIRRRKSSSLKRRKSHGYAENKEVGIIVGASKIPDEETEAVLPMSPVESEAEGSATSSVSDPGEKSRIFDSTPTTPGKASDDEEDTEVPPKYFTQEQAPPCNSTQTTDTDQNSSTSEATATPGDGSSPTTLIPSEAENWGSQAFESSAGPKESLHTPSLMQENIEMSRSPEHKEKDAHAVREHTEALEVPPTAPLGKKQKILKSPRQGSKDEKKPLKTVSSKIDKSTRMTRSRAKANNITKFEKLNKAGKLPVDWTS